MLSAQSVNATNKTAQVATVNAASLHQNVPNPFKNATTIRYNLPQQYNSAKIVISNNGKLLKEINLSGKGQGSVNVDASNFASSTYHYALYIDGKLVESKQMIATK